MAEDNKKVIKLEEYDDHFYDLFSKIKENSQYNSQLIEKAYKLAYEAHKDQRRRSGEPYIMHPVAVARILFEYGMDNECIIGALLHDVVEDTIYSLDYIKENFGEEVAVLVDGVTKLGQIDLQNKEEYQAENIRKMFIAMNQDVRVIIIKLADRLHNMRTLEHMPPYKQREKSLETLEIYAPIAHRLGIRPVKEELEDRAIRYLDPIAYEEIENSLSMKVAQGQDFIDDIKKQISDKISPVMPNAQITCRVKSVHGIFRKMYIKGKDFSEIYDIYAVRIIVDSMIDCYNALGVVHDMFTPLPGRFKDYISTPKPNMYQSLHTTVLSRKGIPFEIQIRTWDMHRTAEYGIAAHWKYKIGKGGKDNFDQSLQWMHKVLENGDSADDAEDMVSSIKGDLAIDEIYVFTPKGDVKSLPKGATVIDFAYAIHSAVGNRMIGAKVDGRIVPLDTVVRTGQVVDIITSNAQGKGPSRDWLNIVKTGEARSKIRAWFKKEKRDENIVQGKAEVEQQFKRNYIRLENDEYEAFMLKIAERQHFSNIEDFYAAIGYGGVQISRMMPGIKDEYNRNWKKKEQQAPTSNKIDIVNRESKASGGVVVEGIDNCLINMARCCNPLPGEPIIGFITRGHGLTIHRRDCKNVPVDIQSSPEPERWINARWNGNIQIDARSSINIYAINRDGLVLDITTTLAGAHIKIHSINARPINDGNCLTSMIISVNGREHLDAIIKLLNKIDGVYLIERSEM